MQWFDCVCAQSCSSLFCALSQCSEPRLPFACLLTHTRTQQVKALLAAALVPNVASMSDASSPSSAPSWLSPVNRSSAGTSTGGGSVGVAQLEEVFVHPSSVCHNVATVHMSQPFVVYLEKVGVVCGVFLGERWAVSLIRRCAMEVASHPCCSFTSQIKTSRTFLRDVTPVSPISLMLFGGPLTVMHQEGTVLVDGWIR